MECCAINPSRIPSLNWLRVFECAARHQNFAQAAEELGMSAPAVSQQIRALETHLGRELFERQARRVVLSTAGRAFLPIVGQSIAAIETTAATLFGPKDAETVLLQSLILVNTGWLARQLPRFCESHPDINLQLMHGNDAGDLKRSDADLVIGFGHGSDFGEHAERLIDETLYPVTTPEIAANLTRIEQLANHRLIEIASNRTGWTRLLEHQPDIDFAKLSFTFVDDSVTAMSLAQTGFGIALARSPLTNSLLELFGLKRCLTPLEVRGLQHYYLERNISRPRRRSVDVVLQWLLNNRHAVPLIGE